MSKGLTMTSTLFGIPSMGYHKALIRLACPISCFDLNPSPRLFKMLRVYHGSFTAGWRHHCNPVAMLVVILKPTTSSSKT